MQLQIFVISLPHEKERQKSIGEQLSSYGLEYEIVDAVYGKDLGKQELEAFNASVTRNYRRALSPNESGCYLSHLNLYKRIVDEAIPCTLILEDDALIKQDLKQVFDLIDQFETPWEMLNIGSVPGKYRDSYLKEQKNGYSLVEFTGKAVGAHAYLLSLEGARKLHADCKKPIRAIDVQMTFIWSNGITGYYYLMPNVVSVNEKLVSSITSERDTQNEKFSDVSSKLNLGYFLSSLSMQLQRKLYDWKCRLKLLTGKLKKPDEGLFK